MMKNKLPLLTLLGAASITAGPLTAGEIAPVAAPSEAKLTGSLALDYNSHFVSYGFDVWGGGKSPSNNGTFNPSLGLDYKLNENWSLNAGIWLDVNNNVKGGDSSYKEQETDLWFGVAYTSGITTVSLTYQDWYYARDHEQVLDLAVSFDTFLSPSITLHHRLDEGASGGFDGTFLVLGAEHSFEICEKFSVTVPVAVGFALDDFHTTDSGYGYASIGLQGSYSLSDNAAINFGITYYDTDDDVVGNATDSSFFTYNAGVSFSF